MEQIIVLILSIAVLGLLAGSFGVDSRDGIEDTHRGHVRPEAL